MALQHPAGDTVQQCVPQTCVLGLQSKAATFQFPVYAKRCLLWTNPATARIKLIYGCLFGGQDIQEFHQREDKQITNKSF